MSFSGWCFTGSLVILFYQVYHFLRYGFWKSVSIYTILSRSMQDSVGDFFYNWQDWLGIKHMLMWIIKELSLSPALFLLSMLTFYFSEEEVRDRKRRKREGARQREEEYKSATEWRNYRDPE